ncbi:MAG: thiamine pyrophosphate-dependent dehydrogenase E1 component subunit alpha [Sulfuritalea sp.]|nr:thiamine pyrophosphate-dependent dehydrogenase E1 component subunit alpha [Sulfuritalea sp.]
MFRAMLRIRRVEEAIAVRYAEQEMRCPMHLCIGQEAIAAGVCAAMAAGDRAFSNHRAHGHYLAMGGNLNAMIAELYGRTDGCCGGRGGSMHLIDLAVGFMGSTPIVGGTVPLAVGSAWASSLQQDGRVTVVFFGDGCFEEGVVHESMNFSALHKLPVVFVCENNDFSVYTKRLERQPSRPIHRVAEAHGLDACVGNGNDVDQVLALTRDAIDRARRGAGPQFIELSTYRWREHCGPDFDDALQYRSAEEIEAGVEDCPIARYSARLTSMDPLFQGAIARYETDLAREIDAAFEFALASSKPTSADAVKKVHA